MVSREGRLGRPVLFITQNVSLMFQQASACEAETRLKVGRYCGGEYHLGGEQSLISENSLEASWRQEISTKEAAFFTGGLFETLCEKGILSLLDFSLLVIDEVHHTKKGHVFNRLIKNHFLTLKPAERPKVLSLSATICEPQEDVPETTTAIIAMAKSLRSILATPTNKDSLEALEHVTNIPHVEFRAVQPHDKFEL